MAGQRLGWSWGIKSVYAPPLAGADNTGWRVESGDTDLLVNKTNAVVDFYILYFVVFYTSQVGCCIIVSGRDMSLFIVPQLRLCVSSESESICPAPLRPPLVSETVELCPALYTVTV